jgi:hypothetical protein
MKRIPNRVLYNFAHVIELPVILLQTVQKFCSKATKEVHMILYADENYFSYTRSSKKNATVLNYCNYVNYNLKTI